MQETRSKVGWVLAGVGAVLFGGLMFYLFNPRWFGERFIHFNGVIERLEPLGPDRLLVIEGVQTGGGEDGPMPVGDRWRVLEQSSGKTLVGPYYVDPVTWAAVQDDRFVMMTRTDLEVRDLHNTRLATLDSFKGVTGLRHEPNDVTLGEDGRITAMADDGRLYLLDVHALEASPITVREPASTGARGLSSASVSGLAFKGRPRAQINGQGPDYLEPQWIQDPQSRLPIRAGDGYLMLHYTRVYGSKEGRGPILSAVNANGAEAWRYVLPFEHLVTVVVRGDQLVIGLNEAVESGPGWVRVIRLTSGEEVWKASL